MLKVDREKSADKKVGREVCHTTDFFRTTLSAEKCRPLSADIYRSSALGFRDTLDALACMQALVDDAEQQLEFPQNSRPKRHPGKHALVV